MRAKHLEDIVFRLQILQTKRFWFFLHNSMQVAVNAYDVVSQNVSQMNACTAFEVEARGDSACGIHALCGMPDRSKELFCKNARELIRTYFLKPLSELKLALGSSVVDKVCSSLWPDFAVAMLARENGDVHSSPTPEQLLFLGFLHCGCLY